MLGKYLSGEHLIVSPGFGNRATVFIKLDRSGSVALVLVLFPLLIFILILLFVHRVMLAGYDALARFMLACDDGRIGRQDEGRWGAFWAF